MIHAISVQTISAHNSRWRCSCGKSGMDYHDAFSAAQDALYHSSTALG